MVNTWHGMKNTLSKINFQEIHEYMQEEGGILTEWVVAGTAVSGEYWGVYKVEPFLLLLHHHHHLNMLASCLFTKNVPSLIDTLLAFGCLLWCERSVPVPPDDHVSGFR